MKFVPKNLLFFCYYFAHNFTCPFTVLNILYYTLGSISSLNPSYVKKIADKCKYYDQTHHLPSQAHCFTRNPTDLGWDGLSDSEVIQMCLFSCLLVLRSWCELQLHLIAHVRCVDLSKSIWPTQSLSMLCLWLLFTLRIWHFLLVIANFP